MASPLNAINLIAPGFLGINTEDTPLGEDYSFCEVATNAVIDRRGRIASRRGFMQVSDDPVAMSAVRSMYHFKSIYDSSEHFLSCYNNEIYLGFNPRVAITPAGYVITQDDWQITSMDNKVYFFQRDHEPLVYHDTVTPGTFVLEPLSAVAGASGVIPDMYGNCVLSAWGRLWTSASTDAGDTVFWSDTLTGHVWDAGTAGLLDMTYAWPHGDDKVVGLAAHGNNLIIFGEHQTVVFANADVVGDFQQSVRFALSDSLTSVGCVDRDSIRDTGSDIIWLSNSGVQALGRIIQNESLPFLNMSSSINKDIVQALSRSREIEAEYFPDEGYYLLRIGRDIFCFDTGKRLQDGGMRATRWDVNLYSFHYSRVNGLLYASTASGIIARYGAPQPPNDYLDFGNPYTLSYVSSGLTFGDSSALKFPKKIRATVVGQSDQVGKITWYTDFDNYFERDIVIGTGSAIPGYDPVARKTVQVGGSGQVVNIGFETLINGYQVSIQEMTLFAKLGKQV